MSANAEPNDGKQAFEFLKADIVRGIRDHPLEADQALALIQPGSDHPLVPAALRASAAAFDEDPPTFIYQRLYAKGLVTAFGMALRGLGVEVGMPAGGYSYHVSPRAMQRFAASATAFRCRIRVGNQVVGTGCLLGPSSVLTAWHVIATSAPGSPEDSAADIQVILSDNSIIGAYLPCEFKSFCGDTEYLDGSLPTSDDLLADRHDMALLRLKSPAALHLGAAALPNKPPKFRSRVIYMVHFPNGQDVGYGTGTVEDIPNFTRRYAHDIETDAGSSGAACFDEQFRLVGIHQGRWDASRRLVPVNEFLDELKSKVANDLTPDILWSLNGKLDGPLVIGRDDFFAAVAEISSGGSAAKGLRVKRTDAAGDLSGIPFTFDLLQQVLARKPDVDFLMRISFETIIDDLPLEIMKRVRLAGLHVPDVTAEDGVAEGETAPEAVEADRARRAARSIDTAAGAAGRLAWIFIEHPSAAFGEKLRYSLEAFIDQALRMPSLRLVVAGYEAVALPGQEYQSVPAAKRATAPGMIVEYLRGFSRQHVVDLLDRGAEGLRLDVPPGWSAGAADSVLIGLQARFGLYSRSDVLTVVDRCRDLLTARPARGGQS